MSRTSPTTSLNLLCSDLDACDRYIPWNNIPSTNSTGLFRVNITINSIPFNVPVDTGSTGFLISAKSLGYDTADQVKTACGAKCEAAFEYLSSSKRYYQGYWLAVDLKFRAYSGRDIVSHTPVFAVTESGTCSSFQDGNCTKSQVNFMPQGIQYMGVGFGRLSKEQPQGTAGRNPLLNIEFGSDAGLRSGYVVSDEGLIVGLREKDLDGKSWNFTKLSPLPDTDSLAPPDRKEWSGTPMCVQIDGGICYNGTVLFDTGVNRSYLGVPPEATQDHKTQKDGLWFLRNDTQVTIRIGTDGQFVEGYSFKVGDFAESPQLTPTEVRLSKVHSDGAFVNTGRYFYNGFGLMFDERTGTVGIKRKPWSDLISLDQISEISREQLGSKI